eukprot:7004699-Ditylum_brightwellii.AAC.1
MVAGDYPELNDTKVLDDTDHQQYQMPIRMLNWIVTLGRIKIDSKDHGVVKNGAEGHLEVDLSKKLKEHYPDAEEVIDDRVPAPLLDELAITACVDSDHSHDKMTRRTPVMYQSK